MTPLVLVPGLMCDARLFLPQIAAFSGRRAILIAQTTGHSTVAELAKQILATAPTKFALAGLSMGGIISMEIARLAPDRIERLALLDTNPLADPPDAVARRNGYLEQVRQGRFVELMRDEVTPRYPIDGPRRDEVLDICMAMALDLGQDVFIDQTRALQNRIDQQNTLRSLTIPTLVLCGQADTLCPPERHELMAKLIPNSSLVVLADSGHLPTLEQPQQTNKALTTWLTQ